MGIPPVKLLGFIAPSFGAKKGAKKGANSPKATAKKRTTVRRSGKELPVAVVKNPTSQPTAAAEGNISITPTKLAQLVFEMAKTMPHLVAPQQQPQQQQLSVEQSRGPGKIQIHPRRLSKKEAIDAQLKFIVKVHNRIEKYRGQPQDLNKLYRRALKAVGQYALMDLPTGTGVFNDIPALNAMHTEFLGEGINAFYVPKFTRPKDRRKAFMGQTILAGLADWFGNTGDYPKYRKNLRAIYPEVFTKYPEFWKNLKGTLAFANAQECSQLKIPAKSLTPEEAQKGFHSFMDWITKQIRENPRVVMAALPECTQVIYSFKKQGANLGERVPQKYDDRANLVVPGAAWHYSLLAQPFLLPKNSWQQTLPKNKGPEVLTAASVLSAILGNIGEFKIVTMPNWDSISYIRHNKQRRMHLGIIPNNKPTDNSDPDMGAGVFDD